MVELSVWAALFVFAVVLAFPPGFLRKLPRYLLAVACFIVTEVLLECSVLMEMSSPEFDGGAGAVLAPGLMLLPTVLFLLLLVLRLIAGIVRTATVDQAIRVPRLLRREDRDHVKRSVRR
jgi:hypothetical protein